MSIKLKHPFKHICYNVEGLLKDVDKLSTFMTRLENQAHSDPDRFKYNDYVGYGFEALVECLLVLSPIDNRLNIQDYKPITEDDWGVDGIGTGHDGKSHAIQCKYRSNSTDILTANKDHLSNFVAHALVKYNAKHLTIFTTADKLHEAIAEEMYQGKIRVLGCHELRKLIDKNLAFWEEFRKALKRKK